MAKEHNASSTKDSKSNTFSFSYAPNLYAFWEIITIFPYIF